ncbi:MAG: preprotein translocase subunit YajC [Shewanellaceae bacterium]|nr:preprotein translocase subunit YajC [Shewanellaceae bacterium]
MLIANAYANAGAAPQAAGFLDMLPMLAAMGLIFYFLIYRPQAKRSKEQKNLMTSLSQGNEVLTNGGLVGKIVKLTQDNDYLLLSLNDSTQITLKKDYITAVLPKGSIQSL